MFVDIYNTENKYTVIYADPPWEYRQSGSKTNSRGMAKQHYQTMSTEEIKEIPVNKISAQSAILFLWATFPNINEALEVMEYWGFEYKTAGFVWIKTNKKSNSLFWGMGAYTRANAEVCLIGIKNIKAKQFVKSHAVHQVILSPIEHHSKKPDETRDRIIQLLGNNISKIELFSRQKVNGWDCWGNDENIIEGLTWEKQ